VHFGSGIRRVRVVFKSATCELWTEQPNGHRDHRFSLIRSALRNSPRRRTDSCSRGFSTRSSSINLLSLDLTQNVYPSRFHLPRSCRRHIYVFTSPLISTLESRRDANGIRKIPLISQASSSECRSCTKRLQTRASIIAIEHVQFTSSGTDGLRLSRRHLRRISRALCEPNCISPTESQERRTSVMEVTRKSNVSSRDPSRD